MNVFIVLTDWHFFGVPIPTNTHTRTLFKRASKTQNPAYPRVIPYPDNIVVPVVQLYRKEQYTYSCSKCYQFTDHGVDEMLNVHWRSEGG